MRRLKCEKETIILTNEDDGFYDVYTFNQSLQKRLRAFAEKYPDDCWLKGSSEDGSETYIIKKGRLSLNLRPPYGIPLRSSPPHMRSDTPTMIENLYYSTG